MVQYTKLISSVSEEAHSAAAKGSVLARLRPVTRRVEPAFEDAVSEVAGVAFVAVSFAVVRAGCGGVVVLARVSAAGFLAGVGVGAVCPVVWSAALAEVYLEVEHAEVVGGGEIFSGCGGERIERECVVIPIWDLEVSDLEHCF